MYKIKSINTTKSLIVVTAQEEINGFIKEAWYWVRVTEEKMAELETGMEVDIPSEALNEIG